MVYLSPMMIVRRLLRMHNSAALILPKPLTQAIGLKPGAYVTIDTDRRHQQIILQPLHLKEPPHDGDEGNPPTPTRRRKP